MSITLTVATENWPLKEVFTIARGSRTEVQVVTVRLRDEEHGCEGLGEGVPYARYGETVEGVVTTLEKTAPMVAEGAGRADILAKLGGGAANNALDCAMWALEAARRGGAVSDLTGVAPPSGPVPSAVTLSLDTPEVMARKARQAGGRLIKVKLGKGDSLARIQAVHQARPDAELILDANEGWDIVQYRALCPKLAALGVVMVEQPLPAADDAALRGEERPVLICADESVHLARDIPDLADRYDMVNIKLDKAGGLTGAIEAVKTAERCGLQVMIGCMVGTSLAMMPGLLLAGQARFVDLDGPLWMQQDRSPGLIFEDGMIQLPRRGVWRI